MMRYSRVGEGTQDTVDTTALEMAPMEDTHRGSSDLTAFRLFQREGLSACVGRRARGKRNRSLRGEGLPPHSPLFLSERELPPTPRCRLKLERVGHSCRMG